MSEVPVAWLRHVAAQCGDAKVTAGALRAAGLTARVLSEGTERVRATAFVDFIENAARSTGNGIFGLEAGLSYDIRASGLAAYTALAAATLRDALRNAGRYGRLAETGARYAVIETGGLVRFQLESDCPALRLSRHAAEFRVAFVVAAARRWLGAGFRPFEICFAHLRRSSERDVARRLGVPVRFGAEAIELVLTPDQLALPVQSADPYLLELLTRHADEVIAAHKPRIDAFRTRVERLALRSLPREVPTAGQMAAALGVGERTLARRLASEATSYRQVLDELRVDLARSYLANPELSLAQIAYLLGYGEQAAFTTAFRRWTGTSPRRYRAAHRIEMPPGD